MSGPEALQKARDAVRQAHEQAKKAQEGETDVQKAKERQQEAVKKVVERWENEKNENVQRIREHHQTLRQEIQRRIDVPRDSNEKKEAESERDTLESLESHLKESAPARPTSPQDVSDFAPPEKPEHEKKFLDRVKDFFTDNALVGGMVKLWINFQRTWLEWFPGTDEAKQRKQLEAIEKLYGKFFGAKELQDQVDKLLENSNLRLLKGKGDGIGYAMLKSAYAEFLENSTRGKTPDVVQAFREANTFEQFVTTKVQEYRTTYAGDTSVIYETTLKGIAGNERPRGKPLPTPSAPVPRPPAAV